MKNIYLSIVIPAYNEEKRLPGTLSKIIDYLEKQDYKWEIIIVDDGSEDHTLESLIEFQDKISIFTNNKNCGKGYSTRRGILRAHGQHILLSDADLSTPIEEIEKLLPALDEIYDIAIGSRGLKNSQIKKHQPFYREFMGKMFNKLIKLFVFNDFTDTQCGFKLFKNNVAYDIFTRQKLNGFAFDVEAIYIAKKLGYKIKEIPIIWIDSPNSHVGIATDSIKMFMDLLKIKKIHSGW